MLDEEAETKQLLDRKESAFDTKKLPFGSFLKLNYSFRARTDF